MDWVSVCVHVILWTDDIGVGVAECHEILDPAWLRPLRRSKLCGGEDDKRREELEDCQRFGLCTELRTCLLYSREALVVSWVRACNRQAYGTDERVINLFGPCSYRGHFCVKVKTSSLVELSLHDDFFPNCGNALEVDGKCLLPGPLRSSAITVRNPIPSG